MRKIEAGEEESNGHRRHLTLTARAASRVVRFLLGVSGTYPADVGRVEDELRIDAEDGLGGLDGLEVRRLFSGWGFYRRGLLFAAAWDGELRWRTRQGGRWVYQRVGRSLLDRPAALMARAHEVLSALEVEPAAQRARRRPHKRGRTP